TRPLIKRYLINCDRSFIFSTALPHINMAWPRQVILQFIGMNRERQHLKMISDVFRKGIEEITGETNVSTSQIVPLILGDPRKALHLSVRLSMRGIDTLPIRRPTVPEGSERIRFSLSAALTLSQINQILTIIKEEFNDL
ncbi:MAG: aminotransferase class I/II-fold pyridoxal phosphate-dependent enzyme, partial [Muribaculaceae bacterium]|nr:aminotransferase class I/II-fold pyridoxal phosphate-dependent enzyme [Muribaculaceae bacterium]